MKVQEYADGPDLHHQQTTQNLLALLLAPITTYTTVLTLFALPNYQELLRAQPYSTRKAIAHAVVGSVLKNDTVISTAEDVKAVLDLCHVLVRDQRDAGVGLPSHPGIGGRTYSQAPNGRHQAPQVDMEEAAEEQGWLARMVHLFRSEDLDVQFSVGQSLCLASLLKVSSVIANRSPRIRRRRRPNSMDFSSSDCSLDTTCSSLQVSRTLSERL